MENELRCAVDALPGLVWAASPDGRIDFVNQRWREYTGLSLEQACGCGWQAAVHPEDLPGLLESWRTILASGQPRAIETRLRRFDGEFRWFRISSSPLRDEAGRIVKWYGLSTDIQDRRRVEEALRTHELSFLRIVDSIPAPVAVMSPDGEIEGVNRSVLEYFGKTFEDLKAWATTDAVHPADLPDVIGVWRRAVETGQPYEIESRHRRADGVYRWFHVRGFPLRDTGGRILRWCVLQTDIEDRKQAEEQFQRSEELLAQGQRLAHVGTFSWRVRTDEIAWSEELYRIFEFDPSVPVTLERIRARVYPEDLPLLQEMIERARSAAADFEYEHRLLMSDESVKYVHLIGHASRDKHGQLEYVGAAQDVTRRRLVEEKLRERELNLRQITETIPEMLWSATPEGAIDYCNGRLLDYTGFSAEEIMENGWIKLIHPDDLEPAARAWMSCIKTGTPYRVEVRTIHAADHSYRWCLTKALPLIDQQGRILKWHGTVVDMHDWKQAQEELRNSQAELANMMRVMTVGQLTASIAHEVNQPLSGIITNASTCVRMLNADPPNIEGARETARRTIRDGNRASDVITRLRALFSKKEATAESVDLNDAAREVLALSLSEFQSNRVILRPEFAVDLPVVTGDRVQLQQVILNLLRNASDAMSTVDDRPRQLVIRTERDRGDHVRLTVQDAGVGFAPQVMDRLFEAFYTTKKDGMGMGLSLSRSIIESHHGRLWAAPNEGPGVTFSFSIPCAKEMHRPAQLGTPLTGV
jgi:PAS domain S-box-containing protein